jgi:cytochrome c oxidase cbb3-type subunit 3
MNRRKLNSALFMAGVTVLLGAARPLAGELRQPAEPNLPAEAANITAEQPPGPNGQTTATNSQFSGQITAAALLRVPVSGIVPGGQAVAPDIKNPLQNDPDASSRGKSDFDTFNCSGCHAPNGAGGMGPALSNNAWLFRSSPANIYLSIVQGRSKGMPAFGTLLPDRTIWELVSYIQSIAEQPSGAFGQTTSNTPQSPDREQISANRIQTSTPWRYTEPFSNGQKPE